MIATFSLLHIIFYIREKNMQALFLIVALSFALFITWLTSLTPRTVFGYPVLPMNVDEPSVVGPLLPCPPNDEPCYDPQKACTLVEKDNTFFVGDTPIPKGKWCLPRGSKQCGVLTGKQVWTSDGWRCVCLYPDVASGPDCTLKSACDCNGNVDCLNLLKTQTGEEYDGVGNVYDLKAACECKVPIQDNTIISADPLKCHLDPCTLDGRAPGIFRDGKCHCEDLFWIESNVDNKCHQPDQECNWDYVEKKCKCGPGMVSEFCQSNLYKRPDYVTKRCDGNAGGSVCSVPCRDYCKNNAITTTVENPGKPGTFSCECECVGSGDKCFNGDNCSGWCYRTNKDIDKGSLDLCCFGGYEVCDRWSAATDACLARHFECRGKSSCN